MLWRTELGCGFSITYGVRIQYCSPPGHLQTRRMRLDGAKIQMPLTTTDEVAA